MYNKRATTQNDITLRVVLINTCYVRQLSPNQDITDDVNPQTDSMVSIKLYTIFVKGVTNDFESTVSADDTILFKIHYDIFRCVVALCLK